MPSRRAYVEVRKTVRTVHWRPVSHPLGSGPTNPGHGGGRDNLLCLLCQAPAESDGLCTTFLSPVGQKCREDLGERAPQDSSAVELLELLQLLQEELLTLLPVGFEEENHTLLHHPLVSKCCAGDCLRRTYLEFVVDREDTSSSPSGLSRIFSPPRGCVTVAIND